MSDRSTLETTIPTPPGHTRISVQTISAQGMASPFSPLVGYSLDHLLKLDGMQSLYDAALDQQAGPFAGRVLKSLAVRSDVTDADLRRIPATGPTIFVANHPLGGIDGLMFLELISRARPDVKLLANSYLSIIPELSKDIIKVDVFSSDHAINTTAIRSCVRWLKAGGCLASFPAGEVSRLRLREGSVSDGPWAASVAMLARMTGAQVVPVYFDARNSWIFQALGLVHPLLRTALLPREMLWKRGASIRVRVGRAVAAERLARFECDADAASYLRARTYLMSDAAPKQAKVRVQAEIAPETATELLQKDVDALPADRALASIGTMRVIIADAHELPHVLPEICRLREISFRDAGEGTGKSMDTDEFDRTYKHLFVWDDTKRSVVGAYRLGLTDKLIARSGVAGLYTSTLFRYDEAQLKLLTPGIELGRSFVRKESQNDFATLLLLWQGIGHFAVANPQYRMLFGTVSISDDYPSLCRKLLVNFVNETVGAGDFKGLASPTSPPRFNRFRQRETDLASQTIDNLDDADQLVASIDPNGRGVPVLLRQYLALGAKLVGFNVDSAFGDALDGLIVVDLAKAPARRVARYMSVKGHADFLRYHGIAPTPGGSAMRAAKLGH
ncbi:MAG: lysophospholipid acyltransferase family protein [Phycisphaerales bacterium]|nr:lysophospholipid acyltransferase family protein [Phycisphaerales bacterium]